MTDSRTDSPVVVSCTSDEELASGLKHKAHFLHELQTPLQQHSEKHLSQLPLVGLRKMGPLYRMSMRAESALSAISQVATSRMREVKAHMYTSLKSKSLSSASDDNDPDKGSSNEEMNEVHLHVQEDATTPIGDECDVADEKSPDETMKTATQESLLTYFVDHSRKHTNDLPLVGLRPPGPIYSLSVKIAELCKRRFGGESNLRSHASFLAHLGLSLCDVHVPSIQPFPLTLAGLQVSSTALIDEGLAISSLNKAFDSAVQQAKSLLSTCMSSRPMHAVFDTMPGHDREDSAEEGKENVHEHVPLLTSSNSGCGLHPSHQRSASKDICSDTGESEECSENIYIHVQYV